jgi:CBS domain-containing protein
MKCKDVMQIEVLRLTPQNSARDAAGLMRDQNVGFVAICEIGGKLIGAITDRDIALRVVADGRSPDDTPIGAVLTRSVVSCRPTDELETAEKLMANSHVSRILCTDEAGTLCGVISLPDIIEHEEPGRSAEMLRRIWSREAYLDVGSM